MNITIIGYGNMGLGLARRIAGAGHTVTLTGLSLEKAQAAAATIDASIRVLPPAEAAHAADIVIATTPYTEQVKALQSLGDLTGKTVIDISNPVAADFSGLVVGHTSSAAEEIAKALPGVKLVKAFNTVLAQVFSEGTEIAGQQVQVFIASDDAIAKSQVSTLATSMGFTPVDAGPLSNARNLEPLAMQNIWFAYMAGQGTGIAPVWLHRN
jgi:NADPH-dependent F420 reductase